MNCAITAANGMNTNAANITTSIPMRMRVKSPSYRASICAAPAEGAVGGKNPAKAPQPMNRRAR